MQNSEQRITELSLGLGRNVDGQYVPLDDCAVNLEDLAYAIWSEDSILKPVSLQIYELGVFETHFCPLVLCENPQLSFIALKALASCTYPFSANVTEPKKLSEIYRNYKYSLIIHKKVLNKALEFVYNIVKDPRASSEDFQKAEIGFTFIRNVVIIPSSTDMNEQLFYILQERGLFELIESLKIKSFGSRIGKFSQILAGILYGCFVPFLPIHVPEDEPDEDEPAQKAPPSPKKNDPLALFAAQQKSKKLNLPSRHGHWGGALTVQSKSGGFTYNGPITSNIIEKGPSPNDIIKPRSRRQIVETRDIPPQFTPKVQDAARRIVKCDSFKYVFSKVLPRTFSAYDQTIKVSEQLQMVDLTRFFLEYKLKFNDVCTVLPLVSESNIKYFITMANFYMEARVPVLDTTPLNKALNKVCLLFGYVAKYLVRILATSKDEAEIKAAKHVITDSASDIENFMITLLATKLNSKATVYMLQDAIVSLERLFQLYKAAESERMMKKQTYGDSTSTVDEFDEIFVDYESFDAEEIIKRLTRKSGVLNPFFTCIEGWQRCDDEEIMAIARMVKRFVNHRNGLAHLFKLPYFIIINKVFQNKKFKDSDDQPIVELRDALITLLNKFFYNVKQRNVALLTLLTGPDVEDLYESTDYAANDDDLYDVLGVSQEVRDIVRDNERPVPPPPKPRRRLTQKKAKKVTESESEDETDDTKQAESDLSSDDEDVSASLEKLRQQIIESQQQKEKGKDSQQEAPQEAPQEKKLKPRLSSQVPDSDELSSELED